MKKLMIDVIDRTYQFVHRLSDKAASGVLLLSLAERDPAPPLADSDAAAPITVTGAAARFCTNW